MKDLPWIFSEVKNKKFLDDIFSLVSDSIEIKRILVEADEKEEGVRMFVNLGHTFGHSIELLSDFSIPHGKAVAIGTVMAADYAKAKGICSAETVTEIRNVFQGFGFDLTVPFSENEIFDAMKLDKKKRGGVVMLVLPERIGGVGVYSM